jgi:hypothetical protein
MATILANNFIAAFNNDRSPLIANILIERALRGDYSSSVEIGPQSDEHSDKLIIGNMYLMPADDNTYLLAPTAEAFVLKIIHEQRLVDYSEFDNIDTARLYMTANS